MTRSQTNLARRGDSTPGFKETADIDESARWEAYCALQARKRRNGMQPSFEDEVGFDSSSTFPVRPEPKGDAYTPVDGLGAHARPTTAETANTADAGDLTPTVHGGRGRKAVTIVAVAALLGGIVVAGSVFWHAPGATRIKAEHDIPLASPEPRSTLSPVPAGAPTVSLSAAVVPTEAPPPAESLTARPRIHHRTSSPTRTGADRGHPRRAEIIVSRRATPHLQHVQKANAVAAKRPTVQDRAAGSAVASQPYIHLKPESQQREAAGGERPAASQRLNEYRASQSAYERELNSYEQAMARYYAHSGSEPPPPPRHSTDPASALDALPWRR